MEPFIRILVEDILTFAYCEGRQIEEDFAITQLERIAYSLNSAGPASIEAFVGVVNIMAAEAKAEGAQNRAAQIESMPSHLGIE